MPYPKKSFGQHFLIDPNILRKIAAAIQPKPDDTIVEIGPGRGALTEHLLKSRASVHAIEIDPGLIAELKQKFGARPNLKLYRQDALKFRFEKLYTEPHKLRIAGNIPYNITSPLLFRLYHLSEYIQDIHLLIQKELARRIVARPDTREYGILAVLTRFYGQPNIEFQVSPQVFRPIPKVHSALIRIEMLQNPYPKQFRESFLQTVKFAFGKRRKTLRNALAELLPVNPGDSPVDLQRRAETLTRDEFIALHRWLQQS